MNRSASNMLQKQKNRSSLTIDENSKRMARRKSMDCGYLMPASVKLTRKRTPAAKLRPLDMKPLRVLVERTKLNEMQVIDYRRTTNKTSLKLVNGGLEKKPGKRTRRSKQKGSTSAVAGRKTKSVNAAPFRIRDCCVRIPKNKVLLRLLATRKKKHTARVRPKRTPQAAGKTDEPAAEIAIASPRASNLKRKMTENTDNSPPKRDRKTKGNEFFINIGALTRTTPPRRRLTISHSAEEMKRKMKKKTNSTRRCGAQLNLSALRNRFGLRFFRSYVKVKRIRDIARCVQESSSLLAASTSTPKKKQKNGKNLTVSFLETVEIFGESSESEDFAEFEESAVSTKSTRSRRVENGNSDEEKSFVTSTPCGSGVRTGRGSANRSGSDKKSRKRGSILKRREKSSFSPLKEDQPSPRKEQLKLANEKIVRLRFEEPPEDDEQDTVSEEQSDADDETNDDAVEDEMRNSNIDANSTSSIALESITELITPPPSAEKDDESAEYEITNQEQEESLEQFDNDTTSLDKQTESSSPKGKDNDSFSSALATSLNFDGIVNQESSSNNHEDVLDGEKLALTDTEEDAIEEENVDKSTEVSNDLQQDLSPDDEQPEISNTNEASISNTSDQNFVDASEFVTTALLDEERTEADAVLNDVCQMAAAENAALLTEGENLEADAVEYNSPHNENDEDNDFTSVLTHPEMERSLQSAASTLVPNSQEIVVAAAAVSSQAAVVSTGDVELNEDEFASVVDEVERLGKGFPDDVGLTGDDVMLQASNPLDMFNDDVDDDIISSLRMSSGNIDIGHDKSLPIQVIETEVMAIPNEPDLIFDKTLGTTASILGTQMGNTNDTLSGHDSSAAETNSKISLGRLFQSVKSYVMSPGGGEKN